MANPSGLGQSDNMPRFLVTSTNEQPIGRASADYPRQAHNRNPNNLELQHSNPNMRGYRSATSSPRPDQSHPQQHQQLPLSAQSRDRFAVDNRGEPEKRRRSSGHRSSGGGTKICAKCKQPFSGKFVRALGAIYHVDCFTCRDCNEVVATKFFPQVSEDGSEQYPLCETDYFRRLDLLCYECGGALRGSYITAMNRKYHIEHFTCSVCPTVFGAQDSYYEHADKVYCHYHYSTKFAQRCSGCQTSILKQFVEIDRGGQKQHWHPECYMIHKFWNVRLAPPDFVPPDRHLSDEDDTEEMRNRVKVEEEKMEEKVYRIWSVLSTFEESSAACISDMLLHVSNGAYVDGVLVAKKFILHVELLFTSLDGLDEMMTSRGSRPLAYGREAKFLCKKIVSFFALLSRTQGTGVKKIGVTQELLSLVTGLAHYLKLLIRISLQGALKLERESGNPAGLDRFLGDLSNPEAISQSAAQLNSPQTLNALADPNSDLCPVCQLAIEDECAKLDQQRWHLGCISCANCGRDFGKGVGDARWSPSQKRILCYTCSERAPDAVGGFSYVTKLEQYVFLLRVALARLLSMLKSSGALPHTSDDPNLLPYDSTGGHRIPHNHLEPPKLGDDGRSKSFDGTGQPESDSGYASTINDIRRLRSTRMERTLSSTTKRARHSRIIEGPEAKMAQPGEGGVYDDTQPREFQIVEDKDLNGESRTELAFGHNDMLTLDDIPRIVAAEQAREQRPNSYNHQTDPFKQADQPKEGQPPMGHQRDVSEGLTPMEEPIHRPKKYFSELSALEYFIVRHVAVLSMEPLMEGHFNLDELLALIETRKQTFWGMVGKAFKADKNKGGKKKGVFHVALETLVERDGSESTFGVGPGALRVPAFIDDAISAMSRMDMSVEGVFRKSGNYKRSKELAENIDTKGLDAVDLTKESPVQVANLLKKFLRELPDSILTSKLYKLFITSQSK
jgi:hypothetical protein